MGPLLIAFIYIITERSVDSIRIAQYPAPEQPDMSKQKRLRFRAIALTALEKSHILLIWMDIIQYGGAFALRRIKRACRFLRSNLQTFFD